VSSSGGPSRHSAVRSFTPGRRDRAWKNSGHSSAGLPAEGTRAPRRALDRDDQVSFPDLPMKLSRIFAICVLLGSPTAPTHAVDASPAQDLDEEVLVINGCPIWPYTRCPGVDLSHADLSLRDLAGADLTGAKLVRADLRSANLAGAMLDGADLSAAKVQKANIPAASLRGARLIATDFEFARMFRADLSNADLSMANMEAARATHVRLNGARLIDVNMQETKFQEADFRNAVMKNCFTRFAVFLDVSFEGCDGCPVDW
jgi:uncharacterized protein YjbI with pentapeptide repeats